MTSMFIDTTLQQSNHKLVDTYTHSLYIPIIPASLNNNIVLIELFEQHMQIGIVKRIDFVKRPNDDDTYMAFVHFKKIYANTHPFYMFNMFDKVDSIDVMGTVDSRGNRHTLAETIHHIYMANNWGHLLTAQRIPNRLFIRVKLNKNPIKDTVLNIHQIAANMETTDTVVETLVKKNSELEDTIKIQGEMLAALENKIKEMDKAVSRMKWIKSATSEIVTNLTNRIYSIEEHIDEIDNDLSDTIAKIYYN